MKKHTCLLLWFIVITSVILAFTACNSNPATDGGSTEPSGSQGGADKNLDQIKGSGDCHVFVQTKEESC